MSSRRQSVVQENDVWDVYREEWNDHCDSSNTSLFCEMGRTSTVVKLLQLVSVQDTIPHWLYKSLTDVISYLDNDEGFMSVVSLFRLIDYDGVDSSKAESMGVFGKLASVVQSTKEIGKYAKKLLIDTVPSHISSVLNIDKEEVKKLVYTVRDILIRDSNYIGSVKNLSKSVSEHKMLSWEQIDKFLTLLTTLSLILKAVQAQDSSTKTVLSKINPFEKFKEYERSQLRSSLMVIDRYIDDYIRVFGLDLQLYDNPGVNVHSFKDEDEKKKQLFSNELRGLVSYRKDYDGVWDWVPSSCTAEPDDTCQLLDILHKVGYSLTGVGPDASDVSTITKKIGGIGVIVSLLEGKIYRMKDELKHFSDGMRDIVASQAESFRELSIIRLNIQMSELRDVIVNLPKFIKTNSGITGKFLSSDNKAARKFETLRRSVDTMEQEYEELLIGS